MSYVDFLLSDALELVASISVVVIVVVVAAALGVVVAVPILVSVVIDIKCSSWLVCSRQRTRVATIVVVATGAGTGAVSWCRVPQKQKTDVLSRTLKLKKSSINGGLGSVRFVTSLKLLLKLARFLLAVRSADVTAAGCVVALGARLLSPLSFSVSLIVEADKVRRICITTTVVTSEEP